MAQSNSLIDVVMSWRGFRRLLYVLVPVTAVFLVLDYFDDGWKLQCWNWMFYTGITTFAVTIALAIGAARKLNQTIELLRSNNTLVLTPDEFNDIKDRMRRTARPWQKWCGVIVSLLIVGSWSWFLYGEFYPSEPLSDGTQPNLQQFAPWIVYSVAFILFFVVLIMGVCGFYAGVFLGTGAGHGAFASVLAGDSVRLQIRPDHFDGAVGLKPIGDLYLYQAVLTGVPLLWLAGWWLFIPVYSPSGCAPFEYSIWRGPFVVLWLATLLATYLGFVRPILKLRGRVLREQKTIQRDVVPGIEGEIEDLQQRLIDGKVTPLERDTINGKIDQLAHYLWSVRQMSSWPMDARTRRRYFSLNALVSVAPPVIDIITSSGAFSLSMLEDGPFNWLKALISIFG